MRGRASLRWAYTRLRAEISMWVSHLLARPLPLTTLCPATVHTRAAWPQQRATRGHQGRGPLGEVWGAQSIQIHLSACTYGMEWTQGGSSLLRETQQARPEVISALLTKREREPAPLGPLPEPLLPPSLLALAQPSSAREAPSHPGPRSPGSLHRPEIPLHQASDSGPVSPQTTSKGRAGASLSPGLLEQDRLPSMSCKGHILCPPPSPLSFQIPTGPHLSLPSDWCRDEF